MNKDGKVSPERTIVQVVHCNFSHNYTPSSVLYEHMSADSQLASVDECSAPISWIIQSLVCPAL